MRKPSGIINNKLLRSHSGDWNGPVLQKGLWILAQEILKGELARQKGLNIELGNLNQELVDTLKEREQQIIGLSSQRH